jgi:hypothetical protein
MRPALIFILGAVSILPKNSGEGWISGCARGGGSVI